MRPCLSVLALALLIAGNSVGELAAQAFRRGGVEFNAMRLVNAPPGKAVVVTEFYHHGQIAPNGHNVIVSLRTGKLVPTRVLQLGPGDYCRLAFQTVEGQTAYEIFYGGDGLDPGALPPWTNRDGLLLETRVFKECNLNHLDSVRQAFESSVRIGSDYVPNVFHACNPFSLRNEPFLSHYSGYLHIPRNDTYGFITSSQDCSFLLIDDKLVVEAPGQHRPAYVAQRGSRKDVQLSAGAHKFDYYHAAVGNEAVMALAWEIAPKDIKPANVVAIPSELFRTDAIGRAVAEPVTMRTAKLVPEFHFELAGSVPLPDNDVPLVGVAFTDNSPKTLTMKGKILWDFGDGQTGEGPKVQHVYLHPGVYAVRQTIKYGGKPFEMVNRVYVDQPRLTDPTKLHKLDDYLPILKGYSPERLDAVSLRQLVLAYQAKADRYQPREPDDMPSEPEPKKPGRAKEIEEEPPPPQRTPAERAAARKELLRYYQMAVEVGKVAFLGESAAKGDEELMGLARLVAPMARDVQGDAKLAYQIWQGAAERVNDRALKAECAVEAADIALNDMVDPKRAKRLLDAADRWNKEKAAELQTQKSKAQELEQPKPKETGFFADVKPFMEPPKVEPRLGRFHRILGDYYAATGDGKSARAAYLEAERLVSASRKQEEQTAWRGAHSRSTEHFLRTKEYDRAIGQIRSWQDEFPAEKIEGQLTLMYARYWAGREMHDQAVALAEQLMTVAPDSPYIDQMLMVAAECELRRGKEDRAVATLQDLVKKYPGSPLVPQANELIGKLQSKAEEAPKATPRRPISGSKQNG